MRLFLNLCVTFTVVKLRTTSDVIVQTSKGVIRGKHVDFGTDSSQLFYGQADIFLGIPYAKPPVDELRFKKPIETDTFDGIWDGTKFAPRCPQNDDPLQPFPKELNMSEDCLYLNIFTKQATESSRQPVMVFIDGGNSFTTGGSNPRQLKGTIRNFVMRNIVVVTIQYRLGALGFFTTYSSDFPPNLGMLDQVKALEWIKTEISHFGGDPDEITLCGQSSGACSVNAHTLSPLSQRLFKRAILQSGSIEGCFSITPEGGIINIRTSDGINKAINIDKGYFGTLNESLLHPQIADPLNNASRTSKMVDATNSTFVTTEPYPPTTMKSRISTTESSYTITNSGQTTEPPAVDGVDVNLNNPSQELAEKTCNITAEEWRKGQIRILQSCLHNLTFDVYLKIDGNRTSTWMIVRDNYFLPDTVENLAKKRPNIPIIIGTVQDEDASYAFKLVANGNALKNQGEVFNNWFVDFAKKQRVNGETADKMRKIIAQNYNLSSVPVTTSLQVTEKQHPNTRFPPTSFPPTIPSQTSSTPIGLLYYQEFGTTHHYTRSPQVSTTPLTNRQYDATSVSSDAGQTRPLPTHSYQNVRIPLNADRNSVIDILKTITKISSDAIVVSGVLKEVDRLLSCGNDNVRVFEFVHATQIGCDRIPDVRPWQPVYQGVDILFLWMDEDAWSDPNKVTAKDIEVANELSRRWTEFVKTGSVSNWQPTDRQSYRYCQLDNNPLMKENFGKTARKVFNELIPHALNPSPVISQYAKTTTTNDDRLVRQYTNEKPMELSWSISMSLPDLIINF